MGTQMTKELGVYNEEEKVHTPTGPQRYRLLNKDPRSATVGITRTPIQVECSPMIVDQVDHKKEILVHSKLEELDYDNSPNKEDKLNDSLNKEHENHCPKHECESVQLKTEQKYLETDIDLLESCDQFKRDENKKAIVELNDVRSPTFQISRTPILVECTPELFALHSQIENLSFCDVDIHEEDPSAVLSEDDQATDHNQSSINNWLKKVDNRACDTPINKSFSESPRQVARKQKELNVLKKQLFFTPNIKETSTPKVRTPLGDLQAGQIIESPQKLIRSKQWRNIQEERKRRGIFDTENTPPNLPPLSKVSSAPGKIVDRKRNKINWDEENTLLI